MHRSARKNNSLEPVATTGGCADDTQQGATNHIRSPVSDTNDLWRAPSHSTRTRPLKHASASVARGSRRQTRVGKGRPVSENVTQPSGLEHMHDPALQFVMAVIRDGLKANKVAKLPPPAGGATPQQSNSRGECESLPHCVLPTAEAWMSTTPNDTGSSILLVGMFSLSEWGKASGTNARVFQIVHATVRHSDGAYRRGDKPSQVGCFDSVHCCRLAMLGRSKP